ncbi:MAG: DUF1573 domain-containing protein [Crocinitomicaceae bacterium]
MKHFKLIGLLIGFLILSCNNDDAEVGEMPDEFKKNPTTVEWEKQFHDFGTIPQDTIVEVVYKFKNTGENPLMIADCKATCGCTVPECKQPPVAPGKSGEITVKFNSKNKANKVNKTVKVYMNTSKEFEELKFSVFVDDGFQEKLFPSETQEDSTKN